MSTITKAVDEKKEIITLTINGKKVGTRKGNTVLEAALNASVYIPTLCHDSDLEPFGACRLCVVEIQGMRQLASACTTPVANGMVVLTDSLRVSRARRTTMELIIANHHGNCLTCVKNQGCELLKVAQYLGIDQEHMDRLRKADRVLPIDDSHPAFIRDPNKCILCAKCVRACHEITGIGAIGLAFRGNDTRISVYGDKSIVESICKSCGECVDRCPTAALIPRDEKLPAEEVKSVCPYCGVGCSLYLGIRDDTIVTVRGDADSVVNRGSLCVKGRWGYDFVRHPERLKTPLIRKEGVGRGVPQNGQVHDIFREATWDEALGLVSQKLREIKQESGPDSLACLSSAKCTNEDNYVLQKFARAVLGTNNVDHCARLCHASTVVGALAAFGQGAMSNSYEDFEKTDLFFVIGSNTTDCHPIIGSIIRRRVRSGSAKLIVADPRNIDLSVFADVALHHRPGTDVALLNGLMHVILEEGLADAAFIKERTEGFEEMRVLLEKYTPEVVEEKTGVPVSSLKTAARLFGKAKSACILYGMGITQHTTGTDNVKSVANLLMLTGNIGREGTGFSPLRGQNNVQGACDMGALPNVYPGYQRVDNSGVQKKFEDAWGVELDNRPGLVVTEMADAILKGTLKGIYIMGENPMLSEPYLIHTRKAFEQVGFLIVQDIFLSETAWLADVVFPGAAFAEKDGTFTNTERRVQRVREALPPPGEAKPDWQIVCELAERMGHPFHLVDAAQIMDEIAAVTPIYAGIHFDRLEEDGLQWPCNDRSHPGTPFLHEGSFARGKGKFHALEFIQPVESVSTDFPLILTTGRILEHWHTGTMSRRSRVLDELQPSGAVDIHPEDAIKLGVVENDMVLLTSERGSIKTMVHITEKSPPGVVFMSFHWREAPANILTNNALDPLAKIPEFKVSAIKAEPEVAC